MGEFRVCDVPPVGGRISLSIGKWQVVTADSFVLSVVKNGFQILVQNHFPGVIRKVTVTPQDPKVILRIQEEIRDLISKNAIVQINDAPNLQLILKIANSRVRLYEAKLQANHWSLKLWINL